MSYRFALSLHRQDDTALGQFPVEVDWEPAVEWARFMAFQGGARETRVMEANIEPSWHEHRGPPCASGFRVVLGNGRHTESFPVTYFAEAAAGIASGLVKAGQLADGETYRYQPLAYPGSNGPPSETAAGFDVEDATPEIPTVAIDLATLGPQQSADEIPPVFLRRRVLDEIRALAAAAGDVETGGVLLGHLGRDAATNRLVAIVTAQVHARHARADRTSLHFEAETWTEVRHVIRLRGKDELMAGWWHSHPVSAWCAKCPEERRERCALARGFFSEHDRALHRTVFPHAHTLGLVVNQVSSRESTLSLFGWRNGMLRARTFDVLEAS